MSGKPALRGDRGRAQIYSTCPLPWYVPSCPDFEIPTIEEMTLRFPALEHHLVWKNGVQGLVDFWGYKRIDIIYRNSVTWLRLLLIGWHSERLVLE